MSFLGFVGDAAFSVPRSFNRLRRGGIPPPLRGPPFHKGGLVNRPYRGCVSPLVCADFRGRARKVSPAGSVGASAYFRMQRSPPETRTPPLRCRERPLYRSAEWDKIFTGRRVVAPYGVVRCFSRVGTDVSSVRGRTQFAPTGIAHRRGIMQNFAGATRKRPYGAGNDLCVVPQSGIKFLRGAESSPPTGWCVVSHA